MTVNRVWLIFGITWFGLASVLMRVVPMHVIEIPWVSTLTLAMSHFVPAIGNLAQIPDYSPYIVFAHSVEWLFMPLFLGYGVALNIIDRATGRARPTITKIGFGIVFIGLCLVVLFLWPVAASVSSRDRALVSPIGFYWHSFSLNGAGFFLGAFTSEFLYQIGMHVRRSRK